MKKILMLCLGNICRSPTAEAILKRKAKDLNLNIYVDSAGTAGYHIGEKSDSRSIHHAEKRGYEMIHLARQLSTNDFIEFDYILAMDNSNLFNAKKILPDKSLEYKLKLIGHYYQSKNKQSIIEIPDPYHGGPNDFETVIDLLENCIDGFIQSTLSR